MIMTKPPKITPEVFWSLYSKALNRYGRFGLYDLSRCKSMEPWTESITEITKETIKEWSKGDKNVRTGKEYYRVDLVSWYSYWDEQKEKDRQQMWDCLIAFEHENNKNSWDDELCKLCYIAADLRILFSYHDFSKPPSIKRLLKDRVDKLTAKRMNRVPNSSWLFIFGPWDKKNHGKAFQVFTLDGMTVTEIGKNTGESVIVDKWKK